MAGWRGQSRQGHSLIFHFWIQLQKGSLSQQRHISITYKKCCLFPACAPVTQNISLVPKLYYHLSPVGHLEQQNACKLHMTFPVSHFRVCSSTDPGKFSVQYVCQLTTVWPLIYLDSYLWSSSKAHLLKIKIIYQTHWVRSPLWNKTQEKPSTCLW